MKITENKALRHKKTANVQTGRHERMSLNWPGHRNAAKSFDHFFNFFLNLNSARELALQISALRVLIYE